MSKEEVLRQWRELFGGTVAEEFNKGKKAFQDFQAAFGGTIDVWEYLPERERKAWAAVEEGNQARKERERAESVKKTQERLNHMIKDKFVADGYAYPEMEKERGIINRKSLSDAQEAHYTDELVEKIVKNVHHLVKHLRDNGGK